MNTCGPEKLLCFSKGEVLAGFKMSIEVWRVEAFDAVAVRLKIFESPASASRAVGEIGFGHCDLPFCRSLESATFHLLKVQGVPEKFAM